MIRKSLLPANLNPEERMAVLDSLVRKRHRRGLVTTGWLEDAYPNERDWVDQPGNADARRRIWNAFIHTRKRRSDDR